MNYPNNKTFDVVIIGGGLFGVSLALFLSTVTKNILLVEKEDGILERGSKNNQARVHTGFHYPRSAITAVKSMMLHRKFERDFPNAIMDNFKMLYAISKKHSKISSKRFWQMFKDMNAPIQKVEFNLDLFNDDYIDAVFECRESAFDYMILKKNLEERIMSSGINIMLDTEVHKIIEANSSSKIILKNNKSISGKYIFNITYGNMNNVLANSDMDTLQIKNELVEIALMEPPDEIKELGITLMDGPFFSLMPFPSLNKHSFTHVRYSLHKTWMPDKNVRTPYRSPKKICEKSKYKFMLNDAARYIPCLKDSIYETSLYEIKSVLIKNEINDGRPILFHKDSPASKVISVLGGKIDNIYDLFEIIQSSLPEFKQANKKLLTGNN